MRQKFKPWAHEFIQEHPQTLNIDELKNFHDEKKIILEIGTGKGQFIIKKAEQNPNNNFIGVERVESVLAQALQKLNQIENVNNLFFVSCNAEQLLDCENLKKKVQIIYLNFSDPWPKKRHTKRRLTSPKFLKIYQELLAPNGQIIFKTDNDDLFNYTIEVLENYNIKPLFIDYDLQDENDIMTEYEEKFRKKGVKIKKVIFTIDNIIFEEKT